MGGNCKFKLATLLVTLPDALVMMTEKLLPKLESVTLVTVKDG